MKVDGVELNADVTLDRVMEAVKREMISLDNPGFCVFCGEEDDYCEPDARQHKCESCGLQTVYGAQELLLHMAA